MPLLDPEIETVRVILPKPQVIRLSDTEIAPGNFGGAFIDLSDVPNSYSGQALKTVRVNAGATGLEFVTSGAGAVDSVFGRTGVVVAVSGDYTAAQVTGAVANTRTINTTAPITGGGDLSADRTLAMHVSDTTHDGYLSSIDWNTFNTSASGSYVPTSRTLHIGPTTSDLSANRSFITNVTDDAQTKAAIVPNTAPSAGQALVGNAGGTAYAPSTVSGSGATISLASTGVVSISAIANASLTNSSITIGGVSTSLGGSALGNVTNDTQTKASVVPNTAPSSGQILVGNAGGTAYAKQTVSGSGATITLNDSGVATISAIANASLSNSAITIAGNSTSLGGTVTQDQITGLASTGLVKRTGANALSVVVDTTVGDNLVTLANPSAITFIRINADNTVTARSAANFRSDIGAGTGSGDALTSSPLSQFASTTSLQLLGVMSDETGTGALVFANTPTLVTPALGAATATSINGNTFTTGTYTLTGVAAKTLTFNKSLTLEGTDATTMTFPTTNATIARTDAANTFTGASATTSWTSNTQSASDNSTKLATTAYVDNQVSSVGGGPGHAIYVAASPPTTDVGFFTIVKTGVDLKNNATTDLFTVPTSRTFVCINANIIPTAVTAGAAVAIVWRILESGASGVMTTNTAATSAAPVTTKVWAQIGANTASTSPVNICAAGNKVQFSLTTGWTTSTTVTGNVYVFGYYST